MFAGKNLVILVVAALAVGSIIFGMVQYIQSAERDKVIIELQEKQKERRRKVDEAIRTAPTTVDDSLQYLNGRQRGQ